MVFRNQEIFRRRGAGPKRTGPRDAVCAGKPGNLCGTIPAQTISGRSVPSQA